MCALLVHCKLTLSVLTRGPIFRLVQVKALSRFGMQSIVVVCEQ